MNQNKIIRKTITNLQTLNEITNLIPQKSFQFPKKIFKKKEENLQILPKIDKINNEIHSFNLTTSIQLPK